jgi:hypothetical protein
MPVDFQQIRTQAGEMGKKAPEQLQRSRTRLQSALEVFESLGDRSDEIRERVEKAANDDEKLRCAVPALEPILNPVSEPNCPPAEVNLAADGSQINPSRHEAADFGVVNCGALRIARGDSPHEYVRSELLYYEELEGKTEELIALMRDVGERQLLVDLAKDASGSVVALTDGMLDIYREPHQDEAFKQQFADYLSSLRELAGLKTIVAGYVDKPRADLLVRMLELMDGSEEDMLQRARERPLGGVTDAMLLHGRLLPGMRSAVFGIQSNSSKQFSGPLRLHFFYLNVGFENLPLLARVEIPAWVATDRDLVNTLHATLLFQCRMTGSVPYPYILHRAHEIAVVGMAEREQIGAMIDIELRRNGVDPGLRSSKQFMKDLAGKARYE